MREEFALGLMQPPGTKGFKITDIGLIYGKEEIPYKDLSAIVMLIAPSPITNGVAQVTINGKVKQLAYKFKDRERAAQAFSFANERIAEANGTAKDYKYRLQAHTGSSLEVYETYLILDFVATGSIVANLAKGGSDGGKRINFTDITAIQFKEPAGISVGFIQLTFPGSGENKAGVVASINDENSVPVSPQNLQLAREIVTYIEQRREELRTSAGTVVSAVSAADELKKFKDLLDSGVITQEEFDGKKKQLLGL